MNTEPRSQAAAWVVVGAMLLAAFAWMVVARVEDGTFAWFDLIGPVVSVVLAAAIGWWVPRQRAAEAGNSGSGAGGRRWWMWILVSVGALCFGVSVWLLLV